MLDFDKVLEVFHDYLTQDTICEVIKTSRGYTVLYWDTCAENWYATIHCKTPQVMCDTFLKAYSELLNFQYTKGRRDLTPEEEQTIDKQLAHLQEQL